MEISLVQVTAFVFCQNKKVKKKLQPNFFEKVLLRIVFLYLIFKHSVDISPPKLAPRGQPVEFRRIVWYSAEFVWNSAESLSPNGFNPYSDLSEKALYKLEHIWTEKVICVNVTWDSKIIVSFFWLWKQKTLIFFKSTNLTKLYTKF